MMVMGLATGMSSDTASASGATPDGTNVDDISVAMGGGGGRWSGSRWSAQQASLYHCIFLILIKILGKNVLMSYLTYTLTCN
jgi:hypothetical protein